MTDLRQVFDDVVRFETLLWNSVDQRLQDECGITLGTLNLMLVIERTPRCRVLDIAQALAITVGGASQAVDRLEASERCVRQANPDDRRSSFLELTTQGQELTRLAEPVFDAELERLLRDPLAPAALATLARDLTTLRQSAEVRAADPVVGASSGR